MADASADDGPFGIIEGLPGDRHASAILLDETHDNLPHPVDWQDGRLTLVKPDKTSAAFFVTFE